MTIAISLTAICCLALMVGLRKRKARRYVAEVLADRCVGCGKCTKRCRHQVLTVGRNEEGQRCATVAHPSLCTACGHCREVCHFDAIHLVNRRSIQGNTHSVLK